MAFPLPYSICRDSIVVKCARAAASLPMRLPVRCVVEPRRWHRHAPSRGAGVPFGFGAIGFWFLKVEKFDFLTGLTFQSNSLCVGL